MVVSFVADITDRLQDEKEKDLLLFEAQEEERKRISKELHDGVTQLLAGIQMNLQGISGSPEPETIDKLGEMTEEAIREARALSEDLMPPDLYQNGPIQEIEKLLERTQRSKGMKMELSAPEDDGIGFSTAEVEQEKRDDGGGMGMKNIQQRVQAFDGELSVRSKPGKGTLIDGYLPYEKQVH